MSRKAVIQQQRLVFDDFFKIDQLIVSHEQLDGTMSAPQKRLVFERGDSVAVLLLNLDTKSVVLVEQFKVPTLVARRREDPSTTDGWIVETAAGMVESCETPEAAAIRETLEETGYKIRRPQLISKFFSSPGGTSERIFLYFAEVREADKVGKGGGVDDEDVKVLHVPLDEFFDRLAKGSMEDPKLLVAAYWLQSHLRSHEALQMALDELFERLAKGSIENPKLVAAATWLQDHVKSVEEKDRLVTSFWSRNRAGASVGASSVASAALAPSTVRYPLRDKKHLSVGLKTGGIEGIKGVHSVDLWTNSENTDMMMDRFLGKSISANIRYLGANRDGDSVAEDTIDEALRSAVGRRGHVRIGTVLATTSGQLKAAPYNVQKIFHVATVEGVGAGGGVKADPDKLPQCVVNLLKRVDQENNRFHRVWLGMKRPESILIPMLGAGDGRVSVEAVAEKIIPPAIEYFRHSDMPTLTAIYFLAYTARHRDACTAVLERYCVDDVLARPGEG